jgi:hypothetical protein
LGNRSALPPLLHVAAHLDLLSDDLWSDNGMGLFGIYGVAVRVAIPLILLA